MQSACALNLAIIRDTLSLGSVPNSLIGVTRNGVFIRAALRDCQTVRPRQDVRFGSKADENANPNNVRFTPETGHKIADALLRSLLDRYLLAV